MSGILRIAFLVALALYFFILIYLLKKNRMTLKYSLLWMLVGLVMLFVAIFPEVFIWAARLIGVDVPSNALFAVLNFCMIVLLMFLTAVVSGQSNRLTRLTQSLALLEKRVRDLEALCGETANADESQSEENV
ncbi:MAG: DUF2304 domain-containing protein [Ruminococcaceae bacterium]|nr:DUF2304 domain-containing protein [Oscillospiraceae bacterium]